MPGNERSLGKKDTVGLVYFFEKLFELCWPFLHQTIDIRHGSKGDGNSFPREGSMADHYFRY